VRQQLTESFSTLRAVFRNPDLRRLQFAWASSETGKWLYLVALGIFAYQEGGASAVGVAALVRILPYAVAAPLSAPLADRYRRELIMQLATLGRVAAMAGATAVVMLDLPSWIVYVLIGVVAALSATFRPAQSALLPSLARTPHELTAANLASSTIYSVASFAGPAIGGVLIAAASVEAAFGATAALFAIAAFFLWRLGAQPRPQRWEHEAGGHVVGEALAGFHTILRDSRLRVLTGLYTVQTVVAGVFTVLLVVAALELLDLGDAGVGYLNSAFGVGGLLGTGLAIALVGRQRLATDFGIGLVLWGIPLVVVGLWTNAAAALVLVAVIGVGETLVEVAAPTLLQRMVPDDVLARVFGAVESLIIGGMGAGAAVAPALIDGLGVRRALIASGASIPAVALLFWRPLTAIDREVFVAVDELALLRGVPMFAPVPEAALEQLAARLVRVRLEPGETLFREGEPGDRFYVIRDGEVQVHVDGKPVRTQGAGDYFGEIALLRDLPRTATVQAISETTLYGLERDEFLSTVTGHPESGAAAEGVVRSRLAAARPPGLALG
jgi:MFS family permease